MTRSPISVGSPEGLAVTPDGSKVYVTNTDHSSVSVIDTATNMVTGSPITVSCLDNGMKREDSVKDIGALLDWIKTRSDLDPDRVMIMGGSYGGYMTLDRLRSSLAHLGSQSAGKLILPFP